MRTPLHGSRPPFRLPSNVVYFHDWRYVDHGGYRWVDAQGHAPPLWTQEPLPPLHYEYVDVPLGIRLAAQAPQRTEPVLTADRAGPILLMAGNLLHDGGRYRLWYDMWPAEQIGRPDMGNENLLHYAD